LTAIASYKLKFGRPRTQVKLIVHQGAVKSAVETSKRGERKKENEFTNRKTGCRNKTFEVKGTHQNKWTSPLVRCNKNFTKFK
jgi:hypothetical protein